ncbi:MAG TPA: hypothetical protein PLB89_06695 [Flavobacteriales bacterium]|nr:hypothetical protein [Flavobacteriales bacterium]
MHGLLRWFPALVLAPVALVAFLPKETGPVVVPGVFRWRNNAWLENGEERAITSNGVQRVYMKILDIDWNSAHGAHPVSTVTVPYQWRGYGHGDGYWSDSVELVPCIYITNNTFLRIDDAEVKDLAGNLLRKLRMHCPAKVRGVMLDCDWSAKTRSKFFRLTRIMKDSLNVPVTATIRLHQYAQPNKTGVPPADRGMLMPYNVGHITIPGGINSIFDRGTAGPYFMGREPYPLPLDIGLPAFSWGVQFRKSAFMGILQENQVNEATRAGLLSPGPPGALQVVKEDNDAMPSLHMGDEIRVESITPAVIDEVIALARTAVNCDTLSVVYFEAGASTFQRMTVDEVRNGWKGFGSLRTGGYFDAQRAAALEAHRADSAAKAAWVNADTTATAVPTDTTDR